MDGPLVSTIASVSVRDGDYLLLLVVAVVPVFEEGEREKLQERESEQTR